MKEKFDVSIIGAGIGGLVCGCYLAKAGLKVIIIEQHNKPGGYCTSFCRKGYRFDVAVRYLGGIKKGVLKNILEELDIKNELRIIQFDPTDKIITPDRVSYIRANPLDTIQELKTKFIQERLNIERFFKFIMQDDFLKIYTKVKSLSFKELLDIFFKDRSLKFVINSLVLINTGLTNNEIGAVIALILFRSYILDPGYYPVGGMQSFPNILAKIFIESGGKLVLSTKVDKILTTNPTIMKLICNNMQIESVIVVSNIDAQQLFGKLLDIKAKELKILNKLIPSISAFAVYIGLDFDLKEKINEECGILYFSSYNINKSLALRQKGGLDYELNGIICEFPSLHDHAFNQNNKSSIGIAIQSPYQTEEFWEKNREEVAQKLIEKVNNSLFSFKNHINLKITATPNTFYKYTLNQKGAAFGWASIPNQVKLSILPPKTSVPNLYLTGHWCTLGFGQGGVSGVALSGRKTAELILREKKQGWNFKLIRP